MTYKIPKVDVLALAIREALREQKTVISQNKLTELVNFNLRNMDPQFRASEERIRRTTLMNKLAKVEIQTREVQDKSSKATCPVCGKRMRRLRNETIFGGKVTLGYKCRACGYWTGLKKRVPVRYIFNADEVGIAKRERKSQDTAQTKL
jgi:predicted RNA-binding Zn-ribbon protein involved in translation (DUF1610 family)